MKPAKEFVRLTTDGITALEAGRETAELFSARYLDAFPNGPPCLFIGFEPRVWEFIVGKLGGPGTGMAGVIAEVIERYRKES